jgi:hypothetical protein
MTESVVTVTPPRARVVNLTPPADGVVTIGAPLPETPAALSPELRHAGDVAAAAKGGPRADGRATETDAAIVELARNAAGAFEIVIRPRHDLRNSLAREVRNGFNERNAALAEAEAAWRESSEAADHTALKQRIGDLERDAAAVADELPAARAAVVQAHAKGEKADKAEKALDALLVRERRAGEVLPSLRALLAEKRQTALTALRLQLVAVQLKKLREANSEIAAVRAAVAAAALPLLARYQRWRGADYRTEEIDRRVSVAASQL